MIFWYSGGDLRRCTVGFIPFVGWVANYTLVLLGIGAMTRALFSLYFIGNDLALDVDMKPIED
jgi:hypothetical protein